MSHLFASAPATPRHGGRLRLAGLAGAVAAAVGVWLVARYGVGVQLRTPGFPLRSTQRVSRSASSW